MLKITAETDKPVENGTVHKTRYEWQPAALGDATDQSNVEQVDHPITRRVVNQHRRSNNIRR